MQLENCTKPVTRELMKKLKFNNLLGLDESLRNGNFKSGKMNGEILETKRLFPHEILMYRYIIVELGLIIFLFSMFYYESLLEFGDHFKMKRSC